jgi:hypothetical protein
MYLFIEERTGTNIIVDNVRCILIGWGVGARRTVLVWWSVNFRSLELPPLSGLFGLAKFWDKVLILGFQVNLR